MLTVGSSSISAEHIVIDLNGSPSAVAPVALRVVGGPRANEMRLDDKTVEALGPDRCRLTFATPTVRPLRAVWPVLTDESGTEQKIETGRTFELGNLLPKKMADVKRMIFHKRSRISNPETLLFVLDQVYRSPENNAFERIEAAKIMAYRAIEGIDLGALEMASVRIQKALTWVPLLPDEFGIAKTSRYHCGISLLYILYLIKLFQDDADGVDQVLKRIAKSTGSVKECPIAAYNLCLSLLTMGFLAAQRGDETGASAAWSKVIELFREAAQVMPARKPGTFVELTVSLNAAKQAAWALEELRSKRVDPVTGLTPEKLANEFSRLRNKEACRLMASRLRSVAARRMPTDARSEAVVIDARSDIAPRSGSTPSFSTDA